MSGGDIKSWAIVSPISGGAYGNNIRSRFFGADNIILIPFIVSRGESSVVFDFIHSVHPLVL